MSGYRMEYTQREEKTVIDYIVDKNAIKRIKGDKLWKEMADDRIVERTWHSLKRHFQYTMIKNLHLPHYKLDPEHFRLFMEAYNASGVVKRQKKTAPPAPRILAPQNGSALYPERKLADLAGAAFSDSDDEDEDRRRVVKRPKETAPRVLGPQNGSALFPGRKLADLEEVTFSYSDDEDGSAL